MTVGKLLEHIRKNNIPMDAEVFVERVEDIYFEKYGWTTTSKRIDSGIYDPEYIESFCPVKYEDDNNLYIDCHY